MFLWFATVLLASAPLFTRPASPPSPAKPNPPATDQAFRAVILDLTSPKPDPGAKKDVLPIVQPSAEAFSRAVPILEQEKVNLVVIRVNIEDSGKTTPPSALKDVTALVRVFQDEYAPRFRIVAWIRGATGPGVLAVWGIAEHYSMEMGNFGAMVPQESDTGLAVRGKALEEWFYLGEITSKYSRRDPAIVRAMLAMEPLSVDVTEGEIRWRQDLKGQEVLNDKGRILCLNAAQAAKFKLSRRNVNTKEELAAALGPWRVEWVQSRALEDQPTTPGR